VFLDLAHGRFEDQQTVDQRTIGVQTGPASRDRRHRRLFHDLKPFSIFSDSIGIPGAFPFQKLVE
jgi:hypothetical protein